MNNFGVIELASAKTTSAPGWAYVPDTGPSNPSSLQPTNRKRARNGPGLSLGDLSARQEARIRKEIEALDKDGGRDAAIPLPAKSGRAQAKHTPNVRKILQSQKTFTNHLDDFLAMQALTEQNATPAAANKRQAAGNRKDSTPVAATGKQNTRGEDVAMADAPASPILTAPYRPPPTAHPEDDNPLLVSRVPEPPSDAELRSLLAHPPLTYLEASGTWDNTYPTRVFCEVCGYWGRVRCLKCGTRVCALDCLETHREECVTRYGL
ncbi:hypothetical protein S40285_00809 [Stachybotrys chlorohalonatus IBT 40285]|uniref:HIT-type domain-containing protein n=1 Tax=Stachybotrys chlorohalonatus (strain IBT 40285) TaxID=1283841 RepID=A0A084QJJ8_STAC4|nr:hypothetical protein S40285_00809 [Stachybotrys chlorohalonata IBT 40285]